jgi:thiol:disulfide interchange protein DsbC
MFRFLMGLFTLAACALAHADEAQIRRVVEAKIEGSKVEGIRAAPLGLYEVSFRTPQGIHIVYTDANADHIIIGNIYDTETERDITKDRLRKLNVVKFDALPLDQAVKIQRGNGKRVLVMFSDPHCPYCKQFEQTLQQMDNITIYVFMFPVIHPELTQHSVAVWCSADRSKAWLDLALRGIPPQAGATCANPVAKNLDLGHRLGVNATPTLIFPNGERVSGGLRLAELTEELEKNKRK